MSAETFTRSPFETSSRSREAQIEALNWDFAKKTPAERITRAYEVFAGRVVLATSFGETSPVSLKLVNDAMLDIPVVTIRHGYETVRTLELADHYQETLGFDLRAYEADMDDEAVPPESTPAFAAFQQKAKVEPFQKMLRELRPLAYFSGRMRWQPGREELPFVEDRGSVLVINPIADMSRRAVDAFFEDNDLLKNDGHFDPAKGRDQDLECQLNTKIYA